MSIKAYDGFRMVSKHFPAVLADLEKSSKVLDQLAHEHQTRFLGHRAATFIDDHALGRLPEPKAGRSPLDLAHDEMDERQETVRVKRQRDPAVDFETKFVLWHCRRQDTYIGLLGCEMPGALSRFLQLGGARAYGYWNNTDPPENLSAMQWAKRAKAWTECLYGDSGPSITIEVPAPAWSTSDQVLAALPSFEERLRRAVTVLASRDYLASRPAGEAESRYEAVSEFARTRATEGSDAWNCVQAAERRAQTVLAPAITRELLTSPLEQNKASGKAAQGA